MASSRPLNRANDPSAMYFPQETHQLPSYGRLAVLNGLLIGLAISLAYWGPKVMVLLDLPVPSVYPGIILSSLLIILLCTVVGWLSGIMGKGWVTALAWLGTAVTVTLLLGHIPLISQNWWGWLADSRFRGLPIYTMPPNITWWSFIIAGLALIFVLVILAILQALRLEHAYNELGDRASLSARAFFILLIPALFAGLGAYMMPDHAGNAPRQALAFTHEGIQVGRTYKGDLFALSRQTGFNYSAVAPVHDQIDGPYQLAVAEIDPFGSLITIAAHFDSGAWINCQVNADYLRATYLSFCNEASRPYTVGFRSLFTGEPLPETCFGCRPQVNAEWLSWLQRRAGRFEGTPHFEWLAQQGSYIWMRAASPNGEYAIDCLFHGIKNVTVEKCMEASK